MNALDEVRRVRSIALGAMRTPRSALIALTLGITPLPLLVHWALESVFVPGLLAFACAVTGLVVHGRQRRHRLRIAPRPGPGRHRLGWLAVALWLAMLAASTWSGWIAVAGTAASLALGLAGLPRIEAAQVAALERRITGTDDHFAAPEGAEGTDFDAPGATALTALLQLTRGMFVDTLSGPLGADEATLTDAAHTLEATGAAVTARVPRPGRGARLVVALTPAGLRSWAEHVAALEAAERRESSAPSA